MGSESEREETNREESHVSRESVSKLGAFGGPNLTVENGPRDIVFAGYGSLVYALEVVNPARPRIAGSFVTSGKVWGLQYADGLLYVANLRNGLIILDASNPRKLRLRGHLATPGNLRRAVPESGHVFMADDPWFIIVDVTDPTKPIEVARRDCGEHAARAVLVTRTVE